jgi:hypothetical protein
MSGTGTGPQAVAKGAKKGGDKQGETTTPREKKGAKQAETPREKRVTRAMGR